MGSGRVGSGPYALFCSLSIKHAVVGIEIDQAVVVGSQQRTHISKSLIVSFISRLIQKN